MGNQQTQGERFKHHSRQGVRKRERSRSKHTSMSLLLEDDSIVTEQEPSRFLDFRAKYSITSDVLGKGRFGKVRRITNRATGCDWAVKAAQTSSDVNCSLIKAEVSILQEISHKNIIKPIDVYDTSSRVYIVLPLCKGGTLSSFLIERLESGKKVCVTECAVLISQLLSAVSHFHRHGIVHRDIKASNILLENNGRERLTSLRVSDFGLATRFDSTSPDNYMRTLAGTASFMAPEVIRRRYRKKADVWSSGVLFYLLLYGKLPFSGHSSSEIMYNVKKGNRSSLLLDALSSGMLCREARAFVDEMLQPDPSKRPSAQAALNHPWLVEKRNEYSSLHASAMTEDVTGKPLSSFSGQKHGKIKQNSAATTRKITKLNSLQREINNFKQYFFLDLQTEESDLADHSLQ
mmetsp:Transcript_46971/g.68655  ORF Transcript_46971/g.68655 Transcript_46971/m.68655 type:complete len:405 (-) Transcript_46971:178-1392(-)